jgi:hypothetical protein
MAAKRASDVYAYGETVRLLEQALKVQEVLDPEDKGKRCDLLLALGDALLSVPDTRRMIESEAPAAFSLAESIGDSSRAARACFFAYEAITLEQGILGWTTPVARQWVERADRYARPGTAERALVDAMLGALKYSEGDIRSGNRLINQSIDLARRTGDRDALWWPASAFFFCCSAPQHTEQRMRLAEELWASSRVGLNASLQTIPLFIGDIFLVMGQRQRAEEVWGELRVVAERTGNIMVELPSAGMDAVLALMDGRLEDAMDMAESIRTRGKEAGIEGVSNLYSIISGIRAQVYLGTSLEARERELPHGSLIAMQELCLVQAHLGRKEEVSEILDKYVVSRPGIGTVEDETRSWIPCSWKQRFL